jgi:hypothetical protein
MIAFATNALFLSHSFASTPVARIYCQEKSTDDSQATITLRSDVVEHYVPTRIEFSDEKGAELFALSDPQPLKSNLFSSTVLFIGMDSNRQWNLYKGEVDITTETGKAHLITALKGLNPQGFSYLRNWGLNRKFIGLSADRKSIAVVSALGTVDILDSESFAKVKSFSVGTKYAVNPQFSADGKYLVVETLAAKIGQVSATVFTVDGSTSFDLPTVKQTYQLSVQVDKNGWATWLELPQLLGSRDLPTTLKAVRLVDVKKTTPKVLKTLPGSSVKPILTFVDAYGVNKAAYTEEVITNDKLTKAALHIITFGADYSIVSEKSYDYESTFFEQSYYYTPSLQNAVFFAPANQLIFAMRVQGGVATFSLNSESWALHAQEVGSNCFNPGITVEEEAP